MDGWAADISTLRTQLGSRNYPLELGRPDFSRSQGSYSTFAKQFLACVSAVNQSRVPRVPLLSLPHIEVPSSRAVSASDVSRETHARTRLYFGKTLDEQAIEMWTLYRAVRRHVWSHVLGPHKRCFEMAIKRLWWDLEGESTPSFCPIALAAIRWRLQWEGGRIPSRLAERPHKTPPLGLVGWSASRPPARINVWTTAFERALRHHLLAADLLDSWLGWMNLSLREFNIDKIRWTRESRESFPMRHWACCGGRGAGESGHIFFDVGLTLPRYGQENWQSHFDEVKLQLERIRR
jgi:hypothetical protein